MFTVFTVLGWLVGVVLVIYGVYGLAATASFVKTDEKLTKTEVELMKRDGLLPGEPEYMRTFRVARSEWDLETDKSLIWFGGLIQYGLPLLVGIILTAFLVVKAWH